MLRKFAAFTILESRIGTIPSAFCKTGHRAHFDYEPRPGYLYVRSRMISSRCNDNFDEFPAEEIDKGHLTFLGKPVFVNHHNEDHRRARGMVAQVALHADVNPDKSPDTWVEGLMEIDALRFPKLAKNIVLGHIDRTSMGVDVDYSICSVCANKATTPLEYCRHIPGMKGKRYGRVTASGQKETVLIREKCYGLRFFENSLLVEEPADPTAFFLGEVTLGPGLEHLRATKTASRRVPPQLSQEGVVGEPFIHGLRCVACGGDQTIARRDEVDCMACGHAGSILSVAGQGATVLPYPPDPASDASSPGDCFVQGQSHEAAGPRYPDPADHPWFQTHPVHPQNIVNHWDQASEDEKNSGRRWYADAHLVAKALATLHPSYPHHGSAAEKRKFVHIAAGTLANYSPQTGWETNQHNAARALHEGHGIGGPGSGVFASNQQRMAADRILNGEPYPDVLGGPKIQDFAHLIEHGGDKPGTDPHVVIDRHALSVAAGHRMTEKDYNGFPTTQRHYYAHVAKVYQAAAGQIGTRDHEKLAGHQVQAATWLVRQRLNQDEDRQREQAGEDTRLQRGRQTRRTNADETWEEFKRQHLPNLNANPGTGYVARHHHAYGEVKAPANVDTLRDEECPVCGEKDSWDGNECKVCGFVQPPKEFRDPNTDLAHQVDLRKDNADLDGTDVTDLNQDINDVDRDGLDDETGEPVGDQEGDVQPALVCPNCGTEFEAGEPLTTNMDDPQAGATGDGPAEGDVCPACGKALLESPSDLGMSEPDDENSEEEVPPAKSSAQEPEDEDVRGAEDEDGDDDTDQDAVPPAKKKKAPAKK